MTWGRSPAPWLWALLGLSVAVRFAEPVPDSDLFWHMAYARQMLERGTLVPDHTAFSWTPTDGRMIYCAWASELMFHGLWTRVGPWSVFVFRYLVVGIVLGCAFDTARRAGAGRWALVPVVLLVLALASGAGTLLKPELFSLLGLHLCLWAYASAKIARSRDGEPTGIFYLVPLVLVVWVNSHGGFVMLAPLLAAMIAGEALNARADPAHAFSRRSLVHMGAASVLCLVAVSLTPYGVAYPWQLVQDLLLGARARPDVAWNTAHQTVLQRATLGLHLLEYAAMLAGLLVALAVAVRRTRPAARADRALWLLNVTALALFVGPLRSTYVWPAVATYTIWILVARGETVYARLAAGARGADDVRRGDVLGGAWGEHERPWWPAGGAVRAAAVGLAIFLAGRTAYEARYAPAENTWLGFGIGDQSPVAEAEFLAAAGLGPRLYNVFDAGGYLLWRLDPAYKVMTDARSFPYLAWFDDQQRFTEGEIFDEFLTRYQADTAIIDLRKPALVRRFLAAPGWRLVYYGPVAAVFAPASAVVPEAARAVAPDRFARIRNPQTARRVRDFARLAGDDLTAQVAAHRMSTP